MVETKSIVIQEIAVLLRKYRQASKLKQKQIAERMGISSKYGESYISRLEKGQISNPKLDTILRYLTACGVSWTEFFKQVQTKVDKIRYEQVIKKINLSSATGLTLKQKAKIDRDIAYFRMKISGHKPKSRPLSIDQIHRACVEFGKYRIKIEKIEIKVHKLLNSVVIKEVLYPFYKAFIRECYSIM
jgi:transcriptional regulator with XRE-family HTH domain